MPDREKVIRGYGCCLEEECNECPFVDGIYCTAIPKKGKGMVEIPVDLAKDVLALLKGQEPIEPIELYDDTKCVEDYNRTLAWKCGKCGYYIGGADNFCANCGRAVKWDENNRP